MQHILENVAEDCMGVKDIENKVRVSRESSGSSQQGSQGGRTSGSEHSASAQGQGSAGRSSGSQSGSTFSGSSSSSGEHGTSRKKE